MTNIYALATQKGGVGKSTSAQNIAAGIGLVTGKSVLLVDLDPQADSTEPNLPYEIYPETLRYTTSELFMEASRGKVKDPQKFIRPCPQYDLLPACDRLIDVELEIATVNKRDQLLKKTLGYYRNSYQYIILDCPAHFGLLTLNAFGAADEIFVPLQAQFYALKALRLLSNRLLLAQKYTNKNLKLGGVFLTQFDRQNKICRGVLNSVRKSLGSRLMDSKIRKNVSLAEAPSHKKTIFEYAPKSNGASDYEVLVREILARRK